MSNQRSRSWFKRFGFYFTAMGLGFGLGNLWRFPYVVFDNGGGAFVLLYLFLAFLIGIPLLISELLVGKTQKKPVITSLEGLSQMAGKLPGQGTEDALWVKKFLRYTGMTSIFVCLLVLTYFAVISGWVLYYYLQFLRGLFVDEFYGFTLLSNLRDNGWVQICFAALHIVVVSFLVLRDKHQEKEAWVGYLMPIFALFVVILSFKSMSLEKYTDAVKYLFYPDFSKLSITSPAEALGHLLFTLSLGFGVMITFGSLMPKKSNVPRTSLQIVTVDTVISLFAALLVLPMVMSTTAHITGPELLFQSVPVLFSQIDSGALFGMLFFFCLYVAALGSSIGLLETIVLNLVAKYNIKRVNAVWVSGVLAVFIAVIPAFSSNYFSHLFKSEGGVLLVWDSVLINWILPVLALVVSQVVLYKLDRATVEDEFKIKESPVSKTSYRHWRILLKWWVPLIIIICLLLQLFGTVFKS